jgi:hypothetical protein
MANEIIKIDGLDELERNLNELAPAIERAAELTLQEVVGFIKADAEFYAKSGEYLTGVELRNEFLANAYEIIFEADHSIWVEFGVPSRPAYPARHHAERALDAVFEHNEELERQIDDQFDLIFKR